MPDPEAAKQCNVPTKSTRKLCHPMETAAVALAERLGVLPSV
jgi:hypothetical protein